MDGDFTTLQQQPLQNKLPQQAQSSPQVINPSQAHAQASGLTPGATFAGRMAQQGSSMMRNGMGQRTTAPVPNEMNRAMPVTGNGMTRSTAVQPLHTPQQARTPASSFGGSMTAESQAGAGFLRGGGGSMSQAQFGAHARPMPLMGGQPGMMGHAPGMGPRPVQQGSSPQQVASESAGARFNPGPARPGGVNGSQGGGFLNGGQA